MANTLKFIVLVAKKEKCGMKKLKISKFNRNMRTELASEHTPTNRKQLFHVLNHATKTNSYVVETDSTIRNFTSIKTAIKHYNRITEL